MTFFGTRSYGFTCYDLCILAIGEFLWMEFLPNIPLLVLICKVLANGLPVRLSSGGLESDKVSFVFVCFAL